jgi:hypothetical protein
MIGNPLHQGRERDATGGAALDGRKLTLVEKLVDRRASEAEQLRGLLDIKGYSDL